MEHIEKQQNDVLESAIQLIGSEFATQEQIAKLFETYDNTIITDGASFEFMKTGLKDIKKINTGIEKKRKELTAPALKFQKDLKAHTDGLREQLTPLIDGMSAKITEFEDREKAAKLKIFNERCDQLTANGYALIGGMYVCEMIRISPDEINGWDDEALKFYVDKGKQEIERREAYENRLKEEREKIEKEREELRLQREALEKKYGKIEDPTEPEPVVDIPTEVPTADTERKPEPEPTIEFQVQETPEPTPDGFEKFRSALLEKLESPDKFTRQTLKEWATNLKIESC